MPGKLVGPIVLALLVLSPSAALAKTCRDTSGHQIVCSTTEAIPDTGYYRSVNGNQVHRPVFMNHAPAGASAKCRDGSWSFSQNRRGTCSHHGGVDSWL